MNLVLKINLITLYFVVKVKGLVNHGTMCV